MKTLELKVKTENGAEKVHLRLTCGGQRRLKEMFEDETMSILMGAINEIDKMVAVLDTALNYKNNDNSITDGEELYDLLVDNDTCGNEEFAKIITDIAVCSGIIKKDQANSLVKSVEKTYATMFDSLDDIVENNITQQDTATPTR